MNLRFLGDAFDFWKGALFRSLQEGGVLQDFAVDPMASDDEPWKTEDSEVFARLLEIGPAQIIRHDTNLQDRTKYFSEISHRGDLFLDADTGVATRRGLGARRRSYVMPSEVKQLLDRSPSRLVIIYQHVRAQRVKDRVDAVLSALRPEVGDFTCCSYESSNVAMLFLARRSDRPERVKRHLARLLGPHADGRVR